jgi:hypothetical protein
MIKAVCKRGFYTFNTPKDTPRIALEDGSLIIEKHKLIKIDADNLPPLLKKFNPSIPLTKEQKIEAKRLRKEDSDSWTVFLY